MTPRTVAAGNGWSWIADGFNLFTKNPVMWVVITLVMVIGVMIVSLIPLLGGIAVALLWPVLAAGLLLGCRALDSGQTLEIQHLWAGFQTGDKLSQLIVVGVVYLVATVIVVGIAFAAIGLPAIHSIRGGGASNVGAVLAMASTMLVGALIALALLVPVFMAIWFAPTLILFDNVQAIDAMKQSFAACLKNIVPFLIYGVIAFVLNIIAAIPFGLGYLVLLPVLVCSLYMSYKDIFGATAPAAAVPPPTGNPLLR